MKTGKEIKEPCLFLSDCGNYIAIRRNHTDCLGDGYYDVIAIDGSCIWLSKRYRPKGFNDPRLKYPEFKHAVIGCHNYGRYDRRKRWIYDFDVLFADLDMNKIVQPWEGNCVIKNYTARFRRSSQS